MIAEDDVVASRVTWTGTHTGQFVYLPPTGKRIKVEGITMERVANDKLVEHWGEWNQAELMLQLGILPGPEGTEL
jgi:predicted ester cyclase